MVRVLRAEAAGPVAVSKIQVPSEHGILAGGSWKTMFLLKGPLVRVHVHGWEGRRSQLHLLCLPFGTSDSLAEAYLFVLVCPFGVPQEGAFFSRSTGDSKQRQRGHRLAPDSEVIHTYGS